ncbi:MULTISPECIES: cupredoxin domain-containing protein [Bradyrhizobium]|uniref:cupredoxin domain-containing protein n=1 Tax=Bradyrhizobium TaxID=374 RepID=UPI00155F1FF0|nr:MULTISPECIES: cupredoxin family protein [Bradyrhizobium]MDD1522447.1 copper resistance protein [Bradyrhizobium sp. WBAH30]MDD1546371.1 copper resistance protein [Bradyrhizobium sp. WBAH41]MDD1560970.1 copper resistance protein [Bradyrhizobium sp. WBAH23]MDD1567378.1 copper resistance protein [Bradyrhizobium sp. WBAH33]MDD1594040.1 copper resistance protein [Bradyrhizobium sp. WBAH42]
MTASKRIAVALMSAAFASTAWAGAGPTGHQHNESYSAGEPGDPKKPARIIQITMGEMDGKMGFIPTKIEVNKGDQIKFVLRNNGELDHEVILATTAENLKHAAAMMKNPDMEHDDPNGKRLGAKKTGEIIWKFTKTGEFEYSCLIPGHREAGMIGTVTVR